MVSKQDWLSTALARLIDDGADGVKVERLARTLGVTKGSFYWHFKDRADLLRQTVAFWAERQLGFLQRLVKEPHRSAGDRLAALLSFIESKDIRQDIQDDTAMRLLARREEWVNETVAEIDRIRLNYCTFIFTEMGFDEDDAKLRAHLVYYYQVAEQTVSHREPDAVRRRLNEKRFQLLMTR